VYPAPPSMNVPQFAPSAPFAPHSENNAIFELFGYEPTCSPRYPPSPSTNPIWCAQK
jgi:hypothetical protein